MLTPLETDVSPEKDVSPETVVPPRLGLSELGQIDWSARPALAQLSPACFVSA